MIDYKPIIKFDFGKKNFYIKELNLNENELS